MQQIKLIIAALLICGPLAAQAVPITDLLSGGSIQVGDKLFDQFGVIFADTHDFHAINTDNIEVTALNDGGIDPGPGLRFDISNGEFDVFGDGFFAFTNFVFEFRVTALDPTLRIKDISMDNLGWSTTHTVDGFNDLGFSIFEDVGTAPGLGDLALLDVGRDVLDDFVTSSLADSANFAAQTDIWVTNDIFVWSSDVTDVAQLFAFEQRFSQEEVRVPEPGTLALLGIGLFGMGLARRRRKV